MPLLDSIQRKLEGWRGKLLSLGGRITLLNAVLLTMPLYCMSIFMLPRWVREKIDSIRCRLLWNGPKDSTQKFHLLSWGRSVGRNERAV